MGVSHKAMLKAHVVRLRRVRIEHIKKFEKRKAEVEKRGKEQVKSIINDVTPSDSRRAQWRGEILTGRKRVTIERQDEKADTTNSAIPNERMDKPSGHYASERAGSQTAGCGGEKG